jgi:hypothetical protein
MRLSIALFCAITVLCTSPSVSKATEKQKVKIATLKKDKDGTVLMTVASPNEFYVGGNKHVLYISGRHFDLYDQENEDGHGSLKFHIPQADFNTLTDGSKVYLSYGLIEVENEQELEEMCSQSLSPCWQVGKLNKKQLK